MVSVGGVVYNVSVAGIRVVEFGPYLASWSDDFVKSMRQRRHRTYRSAVNSDVADCSRRCALSVRSTICGLLAGPTPTALVGRTSYGITRFTSVISTGDVLMNNMESFRVEKQHTIGFQGRSMVDS